MILKSRHFFLWLKYFSFLNLFCFIFQYLIFLLKANVSGKLAKLDIRQMASNACCLHRIRNSHVFTMRTGQGLSCFLFLSPALTLLLYHDDCSCYLKTALGRTFLPASSLSCIKIRFKTWHGYF